MNSFESQEIVYDYLALDRGCYEVRLLANGAFFYKKTRDGEWIKKNWWCKQENGKPWIPAKRKSFVSLVKMAIKDGDYE